MGLGIVLLFWAVVGGILGVAGAAVFGGAAALLTRGVQVGRKRAILLSALFPFICLGWAGGVFVFQAIVNTGFLQRDIGIGDASTCPLPNGYALLLIDVTDYGTVFNPRTQSLDAGVADAEDSVAGVTKLQLAGPYMLGSANEHIFDDQFTRTKHLDTYFILDTKKGRHTTFASMDALRVAAEGLGIQPRLEPIFDVYLRYRFTWFDAFSAALLLIPPFIAGVLGLWLVLRMSGRRRLTAARPSE